MSPAVNLDDTTPSPTTGISGFKPSANTSTSSTGSAGLVDPSEVKSEGAVSDELRNALRDKATLIRDNDLLANALTGQVSDIKNAISNYNSNNPSDDEIGSATDALKRAKGALADGSGSSSDVQDAEKNLKTLMQRRSDAKAALAAAHKRATAALSAIENFAQQNLATAANSMPQVPMGQGPSQPTGASVPAGQGGAPTPNPSQATAAPTIPNPGSPNSFNSPLDSPKDTPTGYQSPIGPMPVSTPVPSTPGTGASVPRPGRVVTNAKTDNNVSGKAAPIATPSAGAMNPNAPQGVMGMPMGMGQPQNQNNKGTVVPNLEILDDDETRVGGDVLRQAHHVYEMKE